MATAIATKPAPPHQKMKRPPPPAVQTGVNGAKPSQSSPSPSLGSMRAPSASKHPPSATNINGANGIVNGTGPRSSTRRRDAKSGKPGQDGDRRVPKKIVEPYVKSTSYILRKYRKHPPSIILHLHPTHFRFDQQDGTFSYNSPMRFVLEHIKNETVPHDMIEELLASNVKFYEGGCLIVQIVDHRTAAATSNSKSQPGNDKDIPFSMHNRNESLTPSPYAPYLENENNTIETKDVDGKPASKNLEVPGSAQPRASNSSQGAKNAEQVQKMTTVLFPTPESQQAEVAYYATTPDPKSVNRKQSTTSNVPRTPASATMPHPPTPLSAVPSTPLSAGPANKKQKMLVGTNEIRNFEKNIINALSAPLYLDPVESLQEAQKLLDDMTDSRHKDGYPAPKTRKRTVAELAADEALAAQEQRFMLIMDERLGPSASVGAAGKANAADSDGTAGFEPRFERFKLIEQIKAEHQAKKQREREQTEQRNAMQAAAKAKQDQENEARRREHLQMQEQRQASQEHARVEQQMKQQHNQATMVAMQQQEMRRRQQQQQQAAQQNQTSQPPNGFIPNSSSHMVSTSQAHQSPILRQMTPHSNSSPTVGHATQAGQNRPMNVTSSNQAVTSSPARPPSALQHAHPAPGGVSMVHQRSAQGPSRRGTPQMPNGTPNLGHSTPVMTSATPISRMAHASSPPASMTQTPVMAPQNVAAQHIGIGSMQNLTPEQARQIQIERNRQTALAQQQTQQHHRQQLARQQMQQNGHPAMSPERMQLQYQQAQQLQMQAQHAAYQDQLRKQQAQQMNGIGSPHPGQSQLQPGQGSPMQGHPGQQQLHPGQARPMPNNALAVQMHQIQQKAFNHKLAQIAQQLGGSIPMDRQQQAQAMAMKHAQMAVQAHKQQMQARAAEVEQQRRMMMQAQMNGGMMRGDGGGGVNGMPGDGRISAMGGDGRMNGDGRISGMGMNGVNGWV